MGAAPSAEILSEAPFRPTRNPSGRGLALIPITRKFFPASDSSFFKQLFESRDDPYVRYYMRDYDKDDAKGTHNDGSDESSSSSDVQLDRIPPAPFSQEEYYEYWMSIVEQCQQYETNEELYNVYKNAEPEAHSVIRPFPCAVAFQYDDSNSTPEGCVRLGDTFVRIIGAVGCIPQTTHKNNNKSNNKNNPNEVAPLKLILFLRKSAGDHNMVRVTLFAAWLFYSHCVRTCKMAHAPLPAITFRGLKTNIPLLCFLREMRSRIELLRGNNNDHCVWLDSVFLNIHITCEHARELCKALAKHYDLLLESKPRAREAQSPPPPLASNTVNDNSEGDDGICSNNNNNSISDMEDENVLLRTPNSYRSLKQSFELVGFIDKPDTVIPAMGSSRDEVYLVCIDTTVYVKRSVVSESVEAVVITEVNNNNKSENDDIVRTSETLELIVKRGDILRFEPDEQGELTPYPLPLDGNKSLLHTITASTTDDFSTSSRSTTTSSGSSENSTHNITESSSENNEVLRRFGTWKVDPNVHVENVLLALVHDECKNAREAPADDPRWVVDDKTGMSLCDSNFYIWRFKRKGIFYFYGTVPKFVNSFKKRSGCTRKQRGIASVSGTSVTAPGGDVKQSPPSFLSQENNMQMTPKGSAPHLAPVLTDPTESNNKGNFYLQNIESIRDISTNNQHGNRSTAFIHCEGTEVLYPPPPCIMELPRNGPMGFNSCFSDSLGVATTTISTGNSMVCEQNSRTGGGGNYVVCHALPSLPALPTLPSLPVPCVRYVHPVETQYVTPVPCITYAPPAQPLPILQPLHSAQQQQQVVLLHQAPPLVSGFVGTLVTYPAPQPF